MAYLVILEVFVKSSDKRPREEYGSHGELDGLRYNHCVASVLPYLGHLQLFNKSNITISAAHRCCQNRFGYLEDTVQIWPILYLIQSYPSGHLSVP